MPRFAQDVLGVCRLARAERGHDQSMRTNTAQFLAGGVIAFGLLGFFAPNWISLSFRTMDFIVGGAAAAAFSLAAVALIRRSWARVPLLLVCILEVMLVWTVFFDESDRIIYFALVGMSGLAVLAAAFAMIILAAERNRTARSSKR